MAAFKDLLKRVTDATLRTQLEEEYKRALKNKKFGLVFEEHRPEFTALYGVELKEGMSVVVNGEKNAAVLQVLSIKDGAASCYNASANTMEDHPIVDLVAVAKFEDPIFPVLTAVDEIENAPGDPLWHTLIQADNYHALQLLEYMYRGKVDCIYIDPPYNTGARDWKYNNDYVDSNDAWRHSKWLSMMEKRLAVAKKLLNPADSVLIVTIDEKEYLHLGMLLKEMFPEARIQMVSSVINPAGSSRKDMFSRSDEYIYFCFLGSARVVKTDNDMLHPVENRMARWDGLMRRGANGRREARPNLFYPVYFSCKDGKFAGVGTPLDPKQDRNLVDPPDNCFAVFPIGVKGTESTWGVKPDTFMEKHRNGFIKFGKWHVGDRQRAIFHIQEGTIAAVRCGDVKVLGKDEDGALILGENNKGVTPMTTWVQSSHSAGDHGASLLKKIFPQLRFEFPKSLYAVHDAIRFFVADKPNALILDFFAGSGTTLHAVNLLNAEDGGKRRCIMVTNNEVSDDEAKAFRKQGLKSGDAAWEAKGIARYVTWPRTICSIKGTDVNGVPLKGAYLGGDEENPRQMADGFKANAKFFKLDFVDKDSVRLGRQFKGILPILWMRSGAKGKCPEWNKANEPEMLVRPENGFAVLVKYDKYAEFIAAVNADPKITDVYFVTNSVEDYREMCTELKRGKKPTHLYHSYLENFVIGCRRNAK